MRETARIDIRRHHELFYQTADVIQVVRSLGPTGWDGLRDPDRLWAGATWEEQLRGTQVSAFQHVLRPPFLQGDWEEALMFLMCPGAHVKNLGWSCWAPVASVIIGHTYKEKYVLRR